MLSTRIAERRVEDRFIDLTTAERELYGAVEDYIATTYNQAAAAERAAIGFVMTIYRRRLASSLRALRATLERHLSAITSGDPARLAGLEEDVPDDETADEVSMPKRSRTLNTKRSTPGNGLTSRVCSTASGLVRRTVSSRP